MRRPDSPPTNLPSPTELRERRYELEWLHREAEYRRPERNRGRSGSGDTETKKPGTRPGS